jgi:hypothetical protein
VAFERGQPSPEECTRVLGLVGPAVQGRDGDCLSGVVIDQCAVDIEQDNHARTAYHDPFTSDTARIRRIIGGA